MLPTLVIVFFTVATTISPASATETLEVNCKVGRNYETGPCNSTYLHCKAHHYVAARNCPGGLVYDAAKQNCVNRADKCVQAVQSRTVLSKNIIVTEPARRSSVAFVAPELARGAHQFTQQNVYSAQREGPQVGVNAYWDAFMRRDQSAGSTSWPQVGSHPYWSSFLNRCQPSGCGMWPPVRQDAFGNTYIPASKQPDYGLWQGAYPFPYSPFPPQPRQDWVYDHFDVPMPKNPVPFNMVPPQRYYGHDYFHTF